MSKPNPQNNPNERPIVLPEIPHDTAVASLGEAPSTTMAAIEKAVPQFTKLTLYAFKAEWAVVGEDLQFHFYLPAQSKAHLNSPEGRKAWMKYWLETFQEALDVEARAYFEAEYPQLVVKYTEELASWWFKAGGFGAVTDPALLASRFLERLNAVLERPKTQ